MDELGLLIQSRHPLVCVETPEEERLLTLLEAVCGELGLPLFTWSVTEGVVRAGATQPVYDTLEPAKALAHIAACDLPAVYLLRDFPPYLSDARLVRRLREIAQESAARQVTIVLSGPSIDLPPELRSDAARFPLKL